MRSAPWIAVCSLSLPFLLAACGGGNSASSPPTQPPSANAGGPYTGTVGAAVTFNGAASTDPQGETLTYA
jgi:hypothetical protein